jgi:hypothetical protein
MPAIANAAIGATKRSAIGASFLRSPPHARHASNTNSGSMNAIAVRDSAAAPSASPAMIGRFASIDAHA